MEWQTEHLEKLVHWARLPVSVSVTVDAADIMNLYSAVSVPKVNKDYFMAMRVPATTFKFNLEMSISMSMSIINIAHHHESL